MVENITSLCQTLEFSKYNQVFSKSKVVKEYLSSLKLVKMATLNIFKMSVIFEKI
jgi:hypothetical protein